MKFASSRAALSCLSLAALLAIGLGSGAAPALAQAVVPTEGSTVPLTSPAQDAVLATEAPVQLQADTGTLAPPLAEIPSPVAATEASPAAAGEAAPPAAPPMADAIPAETLPHDLSPMGMYRQADIVVKAVMIGLVFASVVTWTVLIVKLVEYLAAMSAISRGARRIEAAESLRTALSGADGRGPDSRMLRAAARELNRSAQGLSPQGVRERIASHLAQIQARAARHMGRGTGVLATIGSTAPFVGLFGTVWGIMNSFIGISEAQTTNLAVVAPGIAEALLATAIGLVAAIPAVVIYNFFARAITGYRLRLNETAASVERLVSRDLDRAAAGIRV